MSDGSQSKHTFLVTSERQFDHRSRSVARAHAASWSRAQRRRRLNGRPPPDSEPFSKASNTDDPTKDPPRVETGLAIYQDEHSAAFPCANCTPERAAVCCRGDCAYLREIHPNRLPLITQDAYIGSRLDPFISLPQSAIEAKRPGALSPMKRHLFNFLGQDFLTQAVTGNDSQGFPLFSASMLLAYAHYTALTGRRAGPELLELKGEVLRAVNAALSKSGSAVSLNVGFGIATLSLQVVSITTAQLSTPAVQAREGIEAENVAADDTALRDHLMHRNTMIKLLKDVWSKGDLQNARLGRYFLVLSTLSGALAAAATDYTPNFSESDLPPAYAPRPSIGVRALWRSPLYWHGTSGTRPVPLAPAQKTLSQLLQTVSDWLSTFDVDSVGNYNNGLWSIIDRRRHRNELENLGPYTSDVATETVHMYECCRLVTLLMLRAEAQCSSLQEATNGTTIIAAVARTLRKTDIYSLWGSDIGLLFWVVTVCQVADTDSGFRLSLITSLVNCILHKIATSDCHIEVGLRPLQRLKWFNTLCCAESSRPINKMVQLCQFMRVNEDEDTSIN